MPHKLTMAGNSSSLSLIYVYSCLDCTVAVSIATAFLTMQAFFLLPLSLLVLYLGHRRWRQHRSFATTSHSDVFTYHSAAMELVFSLGVIFYTFGKHFGLSELIQIGYYATSIFFLGQMSLHVLTCVERYVAVVHPVIYLGLRQSGGVRIRNISVGCVWLLCFGWMGVIAWYFPDTPYIPLFSVLLFSLVVVSFCSLSVLCVLIRPGPGEMGRNRERVDHSKRRTFYTITAITGVLWLHLLGWSVSLALNTSQLLSYNDRCIMVASANWFTLPNSLVLPLLFLHRAGKLPCCHCSDE